MKDDKCSSLPHPTGIRCILPAGTHRVSLASLLLLRLKQPNSGELLNLFQNQVGLSYFYTTEMISMRLLVFLLIASGGHD